MQESVGSLGMSARLCRDSALIKAHALIDWEGLRALLTGLYKRVASCAGGQKPFDALLMFKATPLGQWHSRSDPKLEHALTVRIDFIHFCGLTLSEAVIDATLVSSAARPRSGRVIDCGDSAEQGADNDTAMASATERASEIATSASLTELTVTETHGVDPDATGLRKGKTSHFGFKAYATVDSKDGFDDYARGVHTAPANQSETTHFEAAVKSADFTPCRTYSDKGVAIAASRKHLRSQGIKSAVMHKAQRNWPLS
jgi:transposase, IS5 family